MCLVHLAQTAIAQSHHIVAMDAVAFVQVIVPDSQVGQRNGKVVDAAVIEKMLLAMLDKFVEAASCFRLIAQLAPGKTLEENLVGLLVVIEECLLGLVGAYRGNGEATIGFIDVTQPLVGQTFVIPYIVLFGIFSLPSPRLCG